MDIALNDYTLDIMIIETSHDSIYRCHNNKTGDKCVIKITKDSKAQNQYELLKGIDHPNIIKPIEFIHSNNSYCTVFPMALDDLYDKILKQIDPLTEEICRKIMKELLLAVDYLHSKSIWHRNIKTENILVFRNGQSENFVLTGFSTAGHFTGKINEYCGTPEYMAPEVFEKKEYDNKIDCWSLGVVMYTLFTGLFPYEEHYDAHSEIDYSNIPPDAQDLIKHLLCVDPNARYSAKEALEHSFFKA